MINDIIKVNLLKTSSEFNTLMMMLLSLSSKIAKVFFINERIKEFTEL